MSVQARQSSSALLSQIERYLALPHQPKPLQLIYSTHSNWPSPPGSILPKRQIDIGVLDSSFNPPHLAHFALAKSRKPQLTDDDGGNHTARDELSYDSLLLLFSVRNADKGMGSKKDASTANRLEMMQIFAKDVEEETKANVAVAIVEEPLMIAKSTIIHEYIREQQKDKSSSLSSSYKSPVRLHWLVGFDTLQRFFQIKYYPSPQFFEQACKKFFEEEKTTFVCARRGQDSLPNRQSNGRSDQDEEHDLLQREEVKPWVDRGVVVMIKLDEAVQSVSSTAIRKTILEASDDAHRVQLKSNLLQYTTEQVAEYLVQETVYRVED